MFEDLRSPSAVKIIPRLGDQYNMTKAYNGAPEERERNFADCTSIDDFTTRAHQIYHSKNQPDLPTLIKFNIIHTTLLLEEGKKEEAHRRIQSLCSGDVVYKSLARILSPLDMNIPDICVAEKKFLTPAEIELHVLQQHTYNDPKDYTGENSDLFSNPALVNMIATTTNTYAECMYNQSSIMSTENDSKPAGAINIIIPHLVVEQLTKENAQLKIDSFFSKFDVTPIILEFKTDALLNYSWEMYKVQQIGGLVSASSMPSITPVEFIRDKKP